MLRKTGIGLLVLALLAPGLAAALGVGDYKLDSYLNQPLDMTVQLTDTGDLARDEILVELASDSDYEQAGVQRSYLHTKLNFEVTLDEQGGGTLHITTNDPVREPYINFLTEVLWPTGRILREYTVLLDPPSSAQQQTAQQPTQTPSRETGTGQTTGEDESVSQPVQPREPAQATQTEEQETSAPVAQTQRPEDRETYTVKQQDTMWSLALDYRPDSSVSVQQMLVALQKLNPEAFIDGNVNLVREGAVLRIPTRQEIRRINTRQALGDIASQNRKWREMLRARGIDPDKAPIQGTPAPRTADRSGSGEGQVKLVTEDGASGEGSGAGGQGSADASQLENQLAIREEKLDRLERENQELSSRLDDLEKQVQTSEKLLKLREQKIARLQDELKKLGDEAGVDVSEDLMQPVDQPGSDEQAADAEADRDQPKQQQPDGETEQVAQADKDGEQPAAGGPADGAGAGDEKQVKGGPGAGPDQQQADGQQKGPDKGADVATEGQQQPADGDQAEAKAQPAERAADTSAPRQPEPQPSLVERILNFVTGNLLMIGVGLVVLIAVVVAAVLVLRRGGQSGGEGPVIETGEDDDFLPTGLMDEDEDEFGFGEGEATQGESGGDEGKDPLEEADLYVVYGRHQQAVDYLRGEIEKQPERTDLKIRQLDILGELGDANAFEQEAAKLAGSAPEVDKQIETVRQNLAGAEQEPSLDDLEMDLSSGASEGGGGGQPVTESASPAAADEEEDLESLDDFGDFDLSLDEESGGSGGEAASEDSESLEFDLGDFGGDEGSEDDTLEFDADFGSEETSGGESGGEEFSLDTGGESGDSGDSGDELGDLEFSLDDLDTSEDSGEEELLDLGEDEGPAQGATESEPAQRKTDEEAAQEVSSAVELDDSFDFELDTGGESESGGESEEWDLESMSSEFTEASEEPASDDLDLSLDELDAGDSEAGGASAEELDTVKTEALDELDTGDAGEDLDFESAFDTGESEASSGEESPTLEWESPTESAAAPEEPETPAEPEAPSEPETASEPETPATPETAASGGEEEAMGADELLGEDDDFDFLGDSDENATKLDLAKAYIDMGDNEGARDILNEVLAEGTEGQQGEARELLSQVG
jgi:pilus assembly protein FimV